MVPNFPKNCVGDFFFPKFRISKKITSQKLHRRGAPLATAAALGCCLAIPRPTFSGPGQQFFFIFARLLFVFWAAVFIFLAGPFFGLCARAARATHKNYDFFIMDFFHKFSLPFGFWSVVFYFWHDCFFLFGRPFFAPRLAKNGWDSEVP